MNTNEMTTRLDAVLAGWNRSDAPGCVASVVLNGRTLLRKGYGMASLEQLVANGPATRMRIGSTTKHFAAILALLLRDEGLLDIDAPCMRYLPELRAAQGQRTLRQFMNHTGGTRDFLDLSMLSNGAAMLPADAALEYQAAQREDNFPAGELFSYNNGGYRMLSIAIERALGMPLAEALQLRLFAPLGMHDSSLWVSDHDLQPGVACSHLALPGGVFRRGVFPSAILGEGGIVSTVDDMQRWVAHLREPHLWPASLSAELTRPTRLNNGFLHPYGLGLVRERHRGVDVIQHSGGVIGGSCQMMYAPEHGLSIVVISNRSDVAAPFVACDLMAEVLGDALQAPAAQADASAWPGLAGRYLCADNDRLLEVQEAGGKLFLDCEGMRLPLEQGDGGLRVNLLGVVDLALAPQQDGTLMLEEQGYRRRHARIGAADADAQAALRRVQGVYFSSELDAEVVIGTAQDAAVVNMRGAYGHNRFHLEPLGGDLFRLVAQAGGLPGSGMLRLRGDGDLRELFISTSRTRGLRLRVKAHHA
ncbi:MAG: serine hydrolase domain-containing protein [Pseudomonadota bacterium]